MKCDLWRGVKVQRTVVCVCVCAHECVCLWLQTVCVCVCTHMFACIFTYTCMCAFVLKNSEQGYF